MTECMPFLNTLKQVLSELDPQSPLQTGLQRLLDIIAANHGYERLSLAIFDPQTATLQFHLNYGDDAAADVRYAPGQGISGQVLASGSPSIIPRMADNPEFLNRAFGRPPDELAACAFICVPILLPSSAEEGKSQETIGVLSADLATAPKEKLEEHCRFLETLAGIIARQAAHLQDELARREQWQRLGLLHQDGDLLQVDTEEIIAFSKTMGMVLQQIYQVAPSRATVLLRGESGTGKELLAEAIHRASPRRDKPCIKLNCAALPADLLESELFGHEKGAFTGAVSAKKGRFEMAHEGTLFLDEIGELSAEAQAKLLRAIQEGEIQRLGSERPIKVDVRLVCATHRPLEMLLEDGSFREDLYYRINVFPVFIPSLRERRDDIIPLTEHFLSYFAREYQKSIKRVSSPAIDLLVQYHWPGNVRELRNCIERAVLLCNEDVIRTYHLPPSLQTAESSATDTDLSFGEAVARFEQELLVEALKKTKGNMLQAARNLRASYRIINYKVKKYGIDVKRISGKK
ncbi:sigma-54-dependent Fis family transcriptional regulator [Desulfohalobium retbaense]|uniref:Transcriptional regulator, NifA subfamily, Fis Family n=1 Tax=Desulfohalobium retbaense (strain ATCC 49708 / DSM 5692 / JCM 16813 / HR100) TaxID=485915 RepID=C8X125_DESRD|nr:sigma 54-interacting transcriptional regulator [Desulfohalobium retbaense]ACV68122.1 transcriptional regulator, NifA subfamily, Fis Family [Desulfohalobium retbaense DSM 5692]